jgi:hypothetical protein
MKLVNGEIIASGRELGYEALCGFTGMVKRFID